MEDIKAYTLDEVAKILKVKRQTVGVYVRSGKLKAKKIGKAYRVTPDAINDFLRVE